MKKVTILTLHLGYGGIENAVSTLANTLVKSYKVEILCIYRLYNEPVYELDDRIKVTYISNIKSNKKEMLHYIKNKNIKMFFKGITQSIRVLYTKYIKTPSYLRRLKTDVIISTRINQNFMVSKYCNKEIKKIAWQHYHHNNNEKNVKKLVKSCKNIDYLVNVSNDLSLYYKTYLNEKSIYIPNALDNMVRKSSKLDSNNIVSVGRFIKEKGFEDLLAVFKKISQKNPNIKLNIIGDGVEKDNLLKLSEKLKLNDKVIFHGYQNKNYINSLLQDSILFIMTSYTESFGLVLIEAMNNGVPCIAYSSAQGANDIIVNGKNGYLIENRNENEMIDKINLLINDEKLRKKLGKKAKECSKKYSNDIVLEKWSKVINRRKKD